MNKNRLLLLLAACQWLMSSLAMANVQLPKLVGDHMVLQRDVKLPIWGWADKGEKVTVTFMGKSYSVKPAADGKWMVTLPALPAGGPYEMTIKGKNTLQIKDILVGEVWIGSGQSNMEWSMINTNNAKQEIAQANFPNIRLFEVQKTIALVPQQQIPSTGWALCSPETVANFSAVAYFFGRDLYHQYNVPIGLISTSWGGTPAEAWTSGSAIKILPEYKAALEAFGTNLEELDKQQKEYNEKLTAWKKSITSQDRGYMANGKTWADTDFDASTWLTMPVPSNWEQPGILPDYDGIVWFRKEITLTEEEAGKPLTLHLAMIDDIDITFFNGVKVGTTSGYEAVREYVVPGNLVKAGRNVIAVRVEDLFGGGGIWGSSALDVSLAGRVIPLAGKWAYQIGPDGKDMPKAPTVVFNAGSPSSLFNGMIAPLIPYAIKGAIWYQGESNAGRAHQYRTLFPIMIQDWRQRWGYDFPFLFVQLANFMRDQEQPAEYEWAELREAQTMTLSLPKTGMAVAIDIGNPDDIHPRNKQDVGKRLALAARKVAYADDQVVYSGPTYESMTIEGNKVRLKFKNIGSGLVVKDIYGYVRGFAIAGTDEGSSTKKFVWAKGYQEGNDIVLYNDAVKAPVAVRYGWSNNPDGNIYNREGLPAVPFRTDDTQGITFGRK